MTDKRKKIRSRDITWQSEHYWCSLMRSLRDIDLHRPVTRRRRHVEYSNPVVCIPVRDTSVWDCRNPCENTVDFSSVQPRSVSVSTNLTLSREIMKHWQPWKITLDNSHHTGYLNNCLSVPDNQCDMWEDFVYYEEIKQSIVCTLHTDVCLFLAE